MYAEGTPEWIKMVKAFMRMFSCSSIQKRYSNNKWYEYLKKNFSKAQSLNQSGKNNSSFGTVINRDENAALNLRDLGIGYVRKCTQSQSVTTA